MFVFLRHPCQKWVSFWHPRSESFANPGHHCASIRVSVKVCGFQLFTFSPLTKCPIHTQRRHCAFVLNQILHKSYFPSFPTLWSTKD